MTNSGTELQNRIIEHLQILYPSHDVVAIADRLITAMGLPKDAMAPARHRNLWDQRDSVLITYGNSIVSEGDKPLHTLKEFVDARLSAVVSAIHILPFFPYSSDDGFSVMDYLMVNPSLGEWEDISAIAKDYKLMSDLVINHMSARSRWFDNFKKRIDPGKDYFFEVSPDVDLSDVVRPRSTPLLKEVQTDDGLRYVWCTFSADQVDLDFSNPQVLLEFVAIVHHYLQRGITLFRMDAVAFLWKIPGTPSIHLQETHEIIKLLRTLIEHHSPDAIIITETNVPNRENLTYFGNANEAHLIYNFSLPPLLLHTLLSGDCRHLKTWMMSMPPAQSGTTYLNFIASHDGIGLRPLDGLLSAEQRDELVATTLNFGGRVTVRKSRSGGDKPYELNIALYDAMKGTIASGPDQWQQARFICAHVIMLALEGIPAFYIHSLFATENDERRAGHTGHNRSINRHIWDKAVLCSALSDGSHHQQVFDRLLYLISLRRGQPAFHPNATQFTLHFGTGIFAFWRQSIHREQSIFCLNNITDKEQKISLSDVNLIGTDSWLDLISGDKLTDLSGSLVLSPYQSVWLSNFFVNGSTEIESKQ